MSEKGTSSIALLGILGLLAWQMMKPKTAAAAEVPSKAPGGERPVIRPVIKPAPALNPAQTALINTITGGNFSASSSNLVALQKLGTVGGLDVSTVDSPGYQAAVNMDYNKAAQAAAALRAGGLNGMVVWSADRGYYAATPGGLAEEGINVGDF